MPATTPRASPSSWPGSRWRYGPLTRRPGQRAGPQTRSSESVARRNGNGSQASCCNRCCESGLSAVKTTSRDLQDVLVAGPLVEGGAPHGPDRRLDLTGSMAGPVRGDPTGTPACTGTPSSCPPPGPRCAAGRTSTPTRPARTAASFTVRPAPRSPPPIPGRRAGADVAVHAAGAHLYGRRPGHPLQRHDRPPCGIAGGFLLGGQPCTSSLAVNTSWLPHPVDSANGRPLR